MIVYLPHDIPHRTTGDQTWVEAGRYKVLRQLDDKRYLIILQQYKKERQLTIIREDEVEW